MKTTKTWVAAAALLAMTGTAQAALILQTNETVLDDTTNLIWLQNWDVNGLADWDAQVSWADDLDFAGSTDWRLPSIGEYVDLFEEYGDLTEVAAFENVVSGDYWSGTESVPGFPLIFFPGNGGQLSISKTAEFFAVAVRPGDVTAAVPEPGTLGLMLAALGAGAMVRRRRSR